MTGYTFIYIAVDDYENYDVKDADDCIARQDFRVSYVVLNIAGTPQVLIWGSLAPYKAACYEEKFDDIDWVLDENVQWEIDHAGTEAWLDGNSAQLHNTEREFPFQVARP